MALSRDESSHGGGDDLELPTLDKAREANRAGDPQKALQILEALWEQEEARSDPMLYVGLAVVSGALGQEQRRSELLEEAVRLFPDSREVHLTLGNVCQESRDFVGAIRHYEEAIRCSGDFSSAHNNCGLALLELRRLGEAQACFRRALVIQPDSSEAIHNALKLANAHQLNGDLQSAIQWCLELMKMDSVYSSAALCVSSLLCESGRVDEALPVLLQLVAAEPSNKEAHFLLGTSYQRLNDPWSAVSVYQALLSESPGLAHVVSQLGGCLHSMGMFNEARSLLEKSLADGHEEYSILCNLASCYRSLDLPEDAIKLLQKAIEIDPGRFNAHHLLLFLYSTLDSRYVDIMLECAHRYWDLVGKRSSDVSEANEPLMAYESAPVDGRLRVAFLTPDLGSHPVGRFLGSFLEHYDRSLLCVELVSPARRFEQAEQELMGFAEHSLSVEGLSTFQARELLRSRRYDLIVETSGFTRDSAIELIAERCAPVQCHYVGYHATTGMPEMDYYIGDDETVPDDFKDQFSERLWRLPMPWLVCTSSRPFPLAESIATNDIPVLGSFSQVSKLGEQTIFFWSAALIESPDAVLILKDRSFGDQGVCDHVLEKFSKFGVSRERIFFLPGTPDWGNHMSGYNMIDICLDTSPWSSATTAFDALGMGVPLAVIRGDTTSARMSSSIVKVLGKSDWISGSPEEFAATVAKMCKSYKEFRRDKGELQKMVLESALFNGKRLAKLLTSAFFEMCLAREKVDSSN